MARSSTAPSAERKAFIADLEMVVDHLRELHQGLLKENREHGGEFTPKQEGKWEGGFVTVRGILVDELDPMLRAWQQGGQFSRKGEAIMAAATAPLAPRRKRARKPAAS